MKDELRKAWDWWVSELASMVPPRLRRLARGKREVIAIQVHPDHLVVSRRGRDGDGGAVRIDLTEPDPYRERAKVTQAVRRLRSGAAATAVLLSEDRVLRKTVNLPAAAAENLREVLGFEMDRHTPFERDEVHYDYKIASADPAKNQIKVDFAVVPKAVVDQVRTRLEEWGITASSIGTAREWQDPDQDFRFVSDKASGGRRRGLSNVTYVLVLAAVALGMTINYLSLDRLRAEAKQRADLVESLKRDVGEASRLQRQVKALTEERHFALNKKTERLATVLVLERLSELLPDDIWLYQVQLSANTAQIHGYAPDASKIVALIENSPHFENAVFRSRVTRDSTSNAENFHISFQVRGGE